MFNIGARIETIDGHKFFILINNNGHVFSADKNISSFIGMSLEEYGNKLVQYGAQNDSTPTGIKEYFFDYKEQAEAALNDIVMPFVLMKRMAE